ncbi:MAG: TM0996/MTH895 family glutaredoxin-like protein [Deltaproteobacteria bacterium]|jgi:small redox-active disulfide protein 2|nr:TM0996/MTH895 family glutaredoxin-like protein [Deltaproteobacteria bacterium]MBW2533986.1 TM0996/MTH895 family glutaredoxin-like protein [Deltaproteobacteria bacterium]
MKVKVLGTGCAKCNKLYALAEQAITDTGAPAELSKVEKIDEIASYGVAFTPALVIEGEVKSTGKLPTVEKIAEWLRAAGGPWS